MTLLESKIVTTYVDSALHSQMLTAVTSCGSVIERLMNDLPKSMNYFQKPDSIHPKIS